MAYRNLVIFGVLLGLMVNGSCDQPEISSPTIFPQSGETIPTASATPVPTKTPLTGSVITPPVKTPEFTATTSSLPEQERKASLPTCDRMPVFTATPVDFIKINEIVTLGNLNPPSHTFPTDHIYFYLTRQPNSDRPDVADVYAPGDLTVTQISASEHVGAGFTDFNITLQPCREITVVLGHMNTLNRNTFGDTSSFIDWHLDNEYSTGGETYRLWSKQVSIPVRAGELLGTAGGNPGQWALDLGVYDQRHHPDMVAAPGRWDKSRYLNALCPLSLYTPGPVLDRLVSLVKRDKVEDEVLPCGSVLQDVPGTAQGCWFLSGIDRTYPEDPHLALVHSNIHPSKAVLSVGNSITNLDSATYEYLPRDSGFLNRDFKDITPDGNTYGFRVPNFNGIIILTMPDSETLFIEAVKGAITDPAGWHFTANKVVFKR